MKKNLFFTAVITAFTLFSFSGCKKDNAPKDYNALFKNTVWTGEFNYTGKAAQPASLEFKDGGQLTWYELSGEFSATWKLENNKLTVSFPSGSGFSAMIGDDNKLTGIQNFSVNSYAVTSASLNTTPDESLDNTTWTAPNLILHFKAGSKVDMQLGTPPSVSYNDVPYVRKAKSIRFSPFAAYQWFTVSSNTNAMAGVNKFLPDLTVYPFPLKKQ